MHGSAATPPPPPPRPGAAPRPLRCVLWYRPGAALPGDLLTSLSKRIGHIAVCTDAFTALAESCKLAAELTPDGTAAPSTVLLLVQPAQLDDVAEVISETRTYAPAVLAWKYESEANPKLSAVVESDMTTWAAAAARMGSGVPDRLGTARTTHGSDQKALSSSVSSPLTPSPVPPPRRAPSSGTAAPPRLRLVDDDGLRPEVVVRPPPPTIVPRPARGPSLTLIVPVSDDGLGTTPSALPPHTPPGPGRTLLTPEEMRMLLGDDPIDSNGHDQGGGRTGEHGSDRR